MLILVVILTDLCDPNVLNETSKALILVYSVTSSILEVLTLLKTLLKLFLKETDF